MSSSTKRSLPFKPPGPARKSTVTATASAPAATNASACRPAASRRSRDKGPDRLVPSSDSSDNQLDDDDDNNDDEDDFGTTIDLDAADLDLDLLNPRPAADKTTRAEAGRHESAAPFDLDGDLDLVDSYPDNNVDLDLDKNMSVPGIPSKLMTRLVHEHLRDERIQIGAKANEALLAYIDMFVREAVARARADKLERLQAHDSADVWLDIDDLEKVTPGLILDF